MSGDGETWIMRGMGIWPDRRTGERAKIHMGSVCIGAVLAGLLGLGVGYYRVMTTTPQFTAAVTEPRALGGVEPGGILQLHHGVSGECGDAGGRIIAASHPIDSIVWRDVKNIMMLPENIEAGGPLGAWRMSKTIKPGVHTGRITLWCYGAKHPLISTFRFNVLSALRG